MAHGSAALNTTWSPDLYVGALRFSASKHDCQLMADSQLPYIVHLCMVTAEVKAALVVEPFDSPDLAIQCALLHDTMEDTATPYDEIATLFGAAVANGVRALTKNTSLPKNERMHDSLQRIQREPPEIWIVKLADRITNLQPAPASWGLEKRRNYCREAREICAALGSASDYLCRRLLAKIARYTECIDAQQRR